jgi:hypothetical protein
MLYLMMVKEEISNDHYLRTFEVMSQIRLSVELIAQPKSQSEYCMSAQLL